MNDWFDDLESCYDCHCYVSILDEHQQVCIPYQKRIQAERDSQLGASEVNPNWREHPNAKLEETLIALEANAKAFKMIESQE